MTTIIDPAGSDRMGVCVVNAGRIAFTGTFSQAMDGRRTAHQPERYPATRVH